MGEKYDRLMQLMAQQEAATGDMASANALRQAVAPGFGETMIDFGNKAIDKYAGILEKKKLKKEAEAQELKKKKLLAQEKDEKRREWLLGEQIKTKREYGVPIPEIGIEDQRRYAPKADSLYYDPELGILVNRTTGTAKPIPGGGRVEGKMADARTKALEKAARARESQLTREYNSRYRVKPNGMGRTVLWDYTKNEEATGKSLENYINENLTPEQKRVLGREKVKKASFMPSGFSGYAAGALPDSSSPIGTIPITR